MPRRKSIAAARDPEPEENAVEEVRRGRYVDKGHKVGTPPKAGEDKRPWSVLAPDGSVHAKMWYEDTANELARIMGKGYKPARVIRRRKKITG